MVLTQSQLFAGCGEQVVWEASDEFERHSPAADTVCNERTCKNLYFQLDCTFK